MADFAGGNWRAWASSWPRTGGTAQASSPMPASRSAERFPTSPAFLEMMDGRVKRLHPARCMAVTSAVRDNAEYKAAMEAHAIAPDRSLPWSTFYPFEATVAKGADYDTIIENTDIGGLAMIRSAAKNHASRTVIVDPADYAAVIAAIRAEGGVSMRCAACRHT